MQNSRCLTAFFGCLLIIACCGCARITAEEEFNAGRIAYASQTREGLAEARARFEKAIEIDRKFWPAAVSLAKLDISEKSYDDALNRLRDIREKCDDPVFRRDSWMLLYQTYRAAGRHKESLNALHAFRAEYTSPPALPLSRAQPTAMKRDKPYLEPGEIQALSEFEEELICLIEGRPLPGRKEEQATFERFSLPAGGADEVAKLVSMNLLRNIEGKSLTFPAKPPPALDDSFEGRLFISIYRRNRDKITLSGKGESLLSAAMAALRKLNVTFPRAKGLHYRLDFEVSRSRGENIDDINLNFAPGLDGLAVKRGTRKGFILPGDLLESDVQSVGMLQQRLESEVGGGSAFTLSWNRFSTEAFLVTGLEPDSRVVPLVRGHAAAVDNSIEARRKAVIAAADFLVRTQRSDGSWPYRFDAASGPLGGRRRYAMHDAEVAHFLLEAYGRFNTETYLKSAERGLARLRGELRASNLGAAPAADGEKFSYILDRVKVCRVESELASLGAAALTCLAFSKHVEVTGKEDYLEPARTLASLLGKMQRENGSFDMFYSPDGSRLPQKPMIYYPGAAAIYYPGAAALALVKLGRRIDDKEMMESAKRALEHYIPEYVVIKKRFDPRLVEAALSLPPEPANVNLLSSTVKMATMYIDLIETGTSEPDLAGAIARAPKKYPVVLPAMVAEACATSLTDGKVERATWERCRDAVEKMAPFLLRHQFDEVSGHYLPKPERAAGGIRSSLTSNLIKSNVVVHWANALLGSIDIEGKKR